LGDAKRIGALVKAVNAVGIEQTYGGVNAILNTMRSLVGKLETAIADCPLSDGSEATTNGHG
jgi:hypothetical protein